MHVLWIDRWSLGCLSSWIQKWSLCSCIHNLWKQSAGCWLRDFCPSGLNKVNRWVSLKCALSSETLASPPAPVPRYSTQHPHPSSHSNHHGQLCTAFIVSWKQVLLASKQYFYGKTTLPEISMFWVFWNRQTWQAVGKSSTQPWKLGWRSEQLAVSKVYHKYCNAPTVALQIKN